MVGNAEVGGIGAGEGKQKQDMRMVTGGLNGKIGCGQDGSARA